MKRWQTFCHSIGMWIWHWGSESQGQIQELSLEIESWGVYDSDVGVALVGVIGISLLEKIATALIPRLKKQKPCDS
ncbi:MAG: hypothetical protein NW237_11000 [Cyanobacteriota bacterium]|nr:hypothetical protein [Cyanobacteriota bacterium]